MKKILLGILFLAFAVGLYADSVYFGSPMPKTGSAIGGQNPALQLVPLHVDPYGNLYTDPNFPTPTPTITPTVTITPTITQTPVLSFTPINTPTITSTPTITVTMVATSSAFSNVIANATPVLAVAAPSGYQFVQLNGFTVSQTGSTSVGVTVLGGNTVLWFGQMDANLTTGVESIAVPYTINCPRGAPVSIGITGSTSSIYVTGTYQIQQ